MDDLAKLEHLAVVNKICRELENHLGVNDKVLGKLGNSSLPLYSSRFSR